MNGLEGFSFAMQNGNQTPVFNAESGNREEIGDIRLKLVDLFVQIPWNVPQKDFYSIMEVSFTFKVTL